MTVAFYETQMPAATFVIGNRTDNETPKTLRVIEFGEVAKLVDNDVIGNISRKKQYFVIEIDIPFLRATAPARLMVLYEHLSYFKSVDTIEMPDALMDKRASELPHAHILPAIPAHPKHTVTLLRDIEREGYCVSIFNAFGTADLSLER